MVTLACFLAGLAAGFAGLWFQAAWGRAGLKEEIRWLKRQLEHEIEARKLAEDGYHDRRCGFDRRKQ